MLSWLIRMRQRSQNLVIKYLHTFYNLIRDLERYCSLIGYSSILLCINPTSDGTHAKTKFWVVAEMPEGKLGSNI